MIEKIIVEGYLFRKKEYPSKEDESKIGGIALCVRPDPYDEKNDIWATLWLNNKRNYSLYLRHKDIYDNIDKAGPTAYKVKITCHIGRNAAFKEIDDIEFLNLASTPKEEFKGFTEDDIKEVTAKAKEQAKNKPPIQDKPAPRDPPKIYTKNDYEDREKRKTEGMVRHGVVCAFINSGKIETGHIFTAEEQLVINKLVEFIMVGRV